MHSSARAHVGNANYQNDLTAKTQGRASFQMEFDHYDFVTSSKALWVTFLFAGYRLHLPAFTISEIPRTALYLSLVSP